MLAYVRQGDTVIVESISRFARNTRDLLNLVEVDEAAQHRLDVLMPQLAKAAGATEDLKARDQMAWVGLMNNCKARVEEIIRAELIYV